MVWLLVAIFAAASLALLLFGLRARRAETRGLDLLLSNLTDDQRRDYQAFGYFEVTGSVTGRRYRIYHGKARNVLDLNSGRGPVGRSFTPQGDLVAGDCMLAQKIAIENYEDEVLGTALPF